MDKFERVSMFYHELINAQLDQLSQSIDLESESAFSSYKNYEHQFSKLQEQIHAIEQQDDQPYSEEQQSKLQDIIGILMSNQSKLVKKIEDSYTQASSTMKQVTTHRKTLTTYGGVDQYDAVAYYFDEKR